MDEGARWLAAKTGCVASHLKAPVSPASELFNSTAPAHGVLTRRPGHLAAAQHVNVQMKN
jgi:hypothetical protein